MNRFTFQVTEEGSPALLIMCAESFSDARLQMQGLKDGGYIEDWSAHSPTPDALLEYHENPPIH